jgi:adenylosuccinate synthase
MARIGVRFADLLDDQIFADALRSTIEEKNEYLKAVLKEPVLDYDEIFDEYQKFRERLAPHVIDANVYLDRALSAGSKVLFEGAQGTLLDVDHGTYPYVTSSNTIAGAVCTGAGVAPNRISGVVGITKAYTTRVGSGQFPTELDDELGRKLRQDGEEFGATTGRPRRCGWFDAVVARHAVRVNGLTSMAITKLDVLTGLKTVRVCVAYEYDGKRIENFPASRHVLDNVTPVYEDLPGWNDPVSDARSLDDLPDNARRYLTSLEELTGTPTLMISVGARRRDTIVLRNAFTC